MGTLGSWHTYEAYVQGCLIASHGHFLSSLRPESRTLNCSKRLGCASGS
jgi:hypothetical protein